MMKHGACAVVAILLSTAQAAIGAGDDIARCREQADGLLRLTCYDNIVISDGNSARLSGPDKGSVPVTLAKASLTVQPKNTDRSIYSPRIELHLRFKNASTKPVVAIGHSVLIRDAFGDSILQQDGKLDIQIAAASEADSPSFYYWEDNQFMPNDPYSKMVGSVDGGTAKVEVVVTRIVFKDGTIEEFK